MVRNHLKLAVRNTFRSKAFSVVNVTGLAIGITCTVLISLWVRNELGYDRFHPDSDRLYEAWNRDRFNGSVACWPTTPRVLAVTLKAEYPEVEEAVSVANWHIEFLFSKDDLKFTDNDGYVTESGFLSMFGFPLLAGDVATALNDPQSIVVTRKFAVRLFGNADVLGKSVLLKHDGQEENFLVTGVMEDLPNNTTFNFNYLLSWAFMRKMDSEDLYWGNNSVATFVKLRGGASIDAFNDKIRNIAIAHSGGEQKNEMFLYPVSKLRLYSRFENGIPSGGRIDTVRLFEVIAFFIILISCINFMNLSTARAENRVKEVGIRKTVGARQGSLVSQFLVESLFIAFLAAILAALFIHLLLPVFNTLTEKNLEIDYRSPDYWTVIVAVTVFAGLLAGSYPAFVLSSFRPLRVLKGNYISATSGAMVRRTLVVFQFAFTIVLAIATLVVKQQIDHAQGRETGYLQEGLIYHNLNGDLNRNYKSYKEELIASGIAVSVSRTFSPITEQWSNTDGLEWEGRDPAARILFDRYSADEDLVRTAGLQLIAGRDMDVSAFPSDSTAALINESAAKVMKFKDPVGHTFRDGDTEWHIVGVFKDFVARSPYQPVAPMVIKGARRDWSSIVHIRLSKNLATREAIARAGKVFARYSPDYPFEYHFADVEYERKFNDEKRVRNLATASGTLAIFISSLGVFGLSIHMARKRVKEIGIRKVLGASVTDIVLLLTSEPVRLIAISFVIGAPIAYWAMDRWLQTYQYKVDIGWWVFPGSGVAILFIALVTISGQTIRAALSNPANSLKHE
ncbi:MAG TPA: ABC transporter permease [Chryseosolibacter sp.]